MMARASPCLIASDTARTMSALDVTVSSWVDWSDTAAAVTASGGGPGPRSGSRSS